MESELVFIEKELKKRLGYPYKWGRKQNDEFDKLTNFIYRTPTFEAVLKEIDTRFKKDKEHGNIAMFFIFIKSGINFFKNSFESWGSVSKIS